MPSRRTPMIRAARSTAECVWSLKNDRWPLRCTRLLPRGNQGVEDRRRAAGREKAAGRLRIADPLPEPVDHDEFELARAARSEPGTLEDVESRREVVGDHARPGRCRRHECEEARMIHPCGDRTGRPSSRARARRGRRGPPPAAAHEAAARVPRAWHPARATRREGTRVARSGARSPRPQAGASHLRTGKDRTCCRVCRHSSAIGTPQSAFLRNSATRKSKLVRGPLEADQAGFPGTESRGAIC